MRNRDPRDDEVQDDGDDGNYDDEWPTPGDGDEDGSGLTITSREAKTFEDD